MTFTVRLLIGFIGSGLALYFAMFFPLTERLNSWLDARPQAERLVFLALMLLNVSGWIVGLAVNG